MKTKKKKSDVDKEAGKEQIVVKSLITTGILFY